MGLTAVSSRRDAIADTLAECPAGAWIATEEFFRFLRASGNDFSVTRNAWNLYMGELQYGSLGYDNGERILEERYLFAFLLEYAATLGLLDVALIPPAGARNNYGSLWGTDDLAYFSPRCQPVTLNPCPPGTRRYVLASEIPLTK